MDLDDFRLLTEVARRGSFASVARDRATDPSTISRAIATLEAALGTRLFQRSTRRLALTEAGRRFLDRLGPVLEELDAARDELAATRGHAVGLLRITSSVAFGVRRLVPLLPALRGAHPALAVELVLTDSNLDLVAEGIDLAVRLGPLGGADLVATRLMDMRYRVVASPAWAAAHAPIAPRDLARADCVRLSLPGFREAWHFRAASGAVESVTVGGTLLLSNPLAVHGCALAGMGPAMLADWLIDADLRDGRLVDLFPALDVTAAAFDAAVWLHYPSRRFLPAKVRATMDFLRAALVGPQAPP